MRNNQTQDRRAMYPHVVLHVPLGPTTDRREQWATKRAALDSEQTRARYQAQSEQTKQEAA